MLTLNFSVEITAWFPSPDCTRLITASLKLYFHHICYSDAICLSTRRWAPWGQGPSFTPGTQQREGGRGVPGVKRGTIRTRVLAKCIPVQQSGERVPTHSFTPGAIYPPLLFSYSSSDAVSLIQHLVHSKCLIELCGEQSALYGMESCPCQVVKIEELWKTCPGSLYEVPGLP